MTSGIPSTSGVRSNAHHRSGLSITLTHPAVNAGQPYGFLVDEEERGTRPGGIQITRQVLSDSSTLVCVLFDIILADHANNPDGSAHTKTRMQDYSMLLQFLAQRSGIQLQSPIGTLLNLFAIGFTADERHMPASSLIKCQLNNYGIYWPPVDPDQLSLSVWDGVLTWSTSYWR